MVNIARCSLEGSEDKVKTVIKSPLHLTGLESLEGDMAPNWFFLSLTLPSEDSQTTGGLLAHRSWIQVQRFHKYLTVVENLWLNGQLC